MHESKAGSRLEAQLTKFCLELCQDLSRPLAKFVAQILLGIQFSQDVVKLSNIGRALGEAIPPIHRKAFVALLEVHRAGSGINTKLLEMTSAQIQ